MAAAAGARPRGALVVFEGLDRSGKTSQARRLTAALNDAGRPAVFWRFPDRSLATGSVIDSYLTGRAELSDEALHLIFAANRWERAAAMREALAAGTHVIVDRYAYIGRQRRRQHDGARGGRDADGGVATVSGGSSCTSSSGSSSSGHDERCGGLRARARVGGCATRRPWAATLRLRRTSALINVH